MHGRWNAVLWFGVNEGIICLKDWFSFVLQCGKETYGSSGS